MYCRSDHSLTPTQVGHQDIHGEPVQFCRGAQAGRTRISFGDAIGGWSPGTAQALRKPGGKEAEIGYVDPEDPARGRSQ